jgi:hypothetical protein
MTQIPRDKRYLEGFAWFDYVRPLSKDDIFVWRGKKAGTELKVQKRRQAPSQKVRRTQLNAANNHQEENHEEAASIQP